ncbi:hypothetical protein [Flavobacterium johnsoniae]|uniref:hypothetical protein n=1 Tax=Flavobacterium johnsoniae TaxID=986 RepID=UPI000EB417D9|nr:hypothetical protein [Flavobacterium johnsoniae]
MDVDLSKEFTSKLGVMLETSLINYKYYKLWCEELIERLDNPPFWIVELSSVKLQSEASKIVYKYTNSEPLKDFSFLKLNDFYIACMYIKYRFKHISWATFLLNSGEYSDSANSCMDCDDFYFMYNQFEDNEYSYKIETEQSGEINTIFSKHIKEADTYYKFFLVYMKKYVNSVK